MKKSKLVFVSAALVSYIVALIGLFLPFISKVISHKGGATGGGNNGLEVGLNFGAFPSNIPNLLVIVGTVVGLVAAIVFFVMTLIKYLKAKKTAPVQVSDEEAANKFSNKKMLISMILFGLFCGFLPFLFCALTLYSYGIASDYEAVGGYFLDYGAPITAVGCLIGGICLYYTTSGLLD